MSRQGVAYSAQQHQDILMQLDPEDLQRAYLRRFPQNAGSQTPSSTKAEPALSTRSTPVIKRNLTAPSVSQMFRIVKLQASKVESLLKGN